MENPPVVWFERENWALSIALAQPAMFSLLVRNNCSLLWKVTYSSLISVDEDYQPVKKASVWLANHQFKQDKHGNITVPFTKSPTSQSIILVNEEDNFSSLENFSHKDEDYDFDSRFYVDRESLLTRNKTSVVVRSLLKIHGVPVSLSLLEDICLKITTNDIDDVTASKEIRNLKFEDNKYAPPSTPPTPPPPPPPPPPPTPPPPFYL